MKKLNLIILAGILFFSCDVKKTSISGKVINKNTGEGIYNALVNYIECKENGDNCTEVVIAQVYTNQSGNFIIDKKTASKSKTKWITVYLDYKKLTQVNNIGLNDKNITIEVTP